MPTLLKVSTKWTGFSGAPGYTNLYFRDFGTGDGSGSDPDVAQAQAAADRVRAFFQLLSGSFPAAVRINVEGTVDTIDSATGELVGSLSVTAPATVSGSATGGYSAASGAVVTWRTAGIRKGRRIRGRTFLVPLASTAYEVDGTLATTIRGNIVSAATTLSDSTLTPDLGVWARPSVSGATDGQWAAVTGSTVPDMSAVLRSRRD